MTLSTLSRPFAPPGLPGEYHLTQAGELQPTRGPVSDRARDLNQDFIEVTKHLGNVTLDAGEKNLHTLLDFQRKAAEATQMDAVTAMTDAQIKVVSDMANVYTQTMRDFLK